jgi:hypothetical protein
MLSPAAVRRWHHQLGEQLAADAERHRVELAARGRLGSGASVRDGRPRPAQAYRLPRALPIVEQQHPKGWQLVAVRADVPLAGRWETPAQAGRGGSRDLAVLDTCRAP